MADTGIPSNLTGTTPSGYSPAYGGVPLIPDPNASALQAIGGNANLLPLLFSQGNAYNQFNYNQRLGQIAGTPGFANVASNLSGQLPQDVADRVAQQAAQRGISTGLSGSPNANSALLRAMGLTSLDLQKLGQEQYGGLLGHFQGAAPFDVNSYLTSPEQQQAANTAANVSAAAPNPKAAADAEFAKLLTAIQAGHSMGAGAPTVSGGLPDISALLAGLQSRTNPAPGTIVGNGPAQTINRGDAASNIGKVPGWQQAVNQVPGRPADAIQNAIFGPPAYGNVGTQGGVGLDPTLNALLGIGGGIGAPNANQFVDMGNQGPFSSPSFSNAGTVGGLGLDPTLNAILGSLGGNQPGQYMDLSGGFGSVTHQPQNGSPFDLSESAYLPSGGGITGLDQILGLGSDFSDAFPPEFYEDYGG